MYAIYIGKGYYRKLKEKANVTVRDTILYYLFITTQMIMCDDDQAVNDTNEKNPYFLTTSL
jgi:hypothetical protein